jgi:hypothetical protein
VLPGGRDARAPGPDDAPPVRLVREWKGPTVRDVLAAQDATSERLPGRVHAVAERARAGDYAGAERRLDATLAALLPGPGARVRGPGAWRRPGPWVLLALAVVAALVVAWLAR